MKSRAKLPARMQVEPSGRCNLSCRMCPGGLRRDGKQKLMHVELLDFLLEQLPGARDIDLDGFGEPLMHPEIVGLVEKVKAMGSTASISSNLLLLDRKTAEGFVSAGLDNLTVSIDGATEATYGWFKRDANLMTVIENMASLVELRNEAGASVPRIRVAAVIMKENVADLPGIVRLSGAMGAESFTARHLCHRMDEAALPRLYRPVRDFVRSQALGEDQVPMIQEAFAVARREADKYGIAIDLPEPLPLPEVRVPACDRPWKEICVSHTGLMLPCRFTGTPDRFNLGDVVDNGIRAIWNGPRFVEFRENLLQGDLPDMCRSCSLTGGCVTRPTKPSRQAVPVEQYQRI